MGGLNNMANRQASMERAQERRLAAAARQRRDEQDNQPSETSGVERRRWIAIGVALVAMTAVVGVSSWVVLGARWMGLALGACVAAVALAAWYTVSGRTIGMNGDVRERVLERHYIGVAWYASMLRTTRERGGYERGLRRELTRLAAARVAERHGVNLYRDPQTAEQVIGPDLWPLVDPAAAAKANAAAGTDRSGARPPEIPIRAVAELIERLERM
jgi:hypothetical protein